MAGWPARAAAGIHAAAEHAAPTHPVAAPAPPQLFFQAESFRAPVAGDDDTSRPKPYGHPWIDARGRGLKTAGTVVADH